MRIQNENITSNDIENDESIIDNIPDDQDLDQNDGMYQIFLFPVKSSEIICNSMSNIRIDLQDSLLEVYALLSENNLYMSY